MNDELKKEIQDLIKQELSFTSRKLTDTPTDLLQVVNKKFVTANGTTALRPANPVVGQFYFDVTLGIPIWWISTGLGWVNSVGSPV